MKVTIPDDLNDDLSAYAAGYNTSKSEVVRNSVASFMGNDLRWTHRQYFFRPRRKLVSFEDLRMCTGFVQVACFPKDLPRNASGVTVKLLKYEKNFSIITFDLGNGVVPHPPYPIQGGYRSRTWFFSYAHRRTEYQYLYNEHYILQNKQ